ncbi:50S ribosomal protein L29 [archaeon]|nr:50S ribosomal protein L29 [archaeon]MBL7056708.1 50S ribosomal protein L29 [Candidatus Woesearchaeota archaeon]
MKFKDLKSMSETDLQKKCEEAKIELIKLNSQAATGTTIKSPGQIKKLKKTIAKIKTVQSSK